jgi:uncharacterized protein (TIGR02597 family)
VYQGSAETVGASSLTDNEATWTDNQFNGPNGAYFLEIVRPTGQAIAVSGEGTTYDIATTVAASKTITTLQPLATGVTTGAVFKIRKHWTIASVFGPANEGGLGAGNSSTADQILIWNPVTLGYDTYYYSSGGLVGVGWRKAGSSPANQDAGPSVIYPDDGVIINRQQAANVGLVLMGAVKTGQTSIPIANGVNFIGNVYAAPITFADSGLYTGDPATGVASGNSSTADQVLIWDPVALGYNIYYYSAGGLVGVGWRKSGSVPANQDASATPIPVGQSVVVKRNAAGGFNWVVPQHPATL